MPKIKVSEASGHVLDWAVAKCEGMTDYEWPLVWRNFRASCNYTTDWSQGGPIVEREGLDVNVVPCILNVPRRWCSEFIVDDKYYRAEGPTPLIAAMRCYVASKLGDEVDVPEGLQ